MAVSFAAGLNVYAAVAMLGMLSRMHWFALPAGLGGLGNTWVIAASAALFCVEFFADKIPMLDLVWNALQIVVRLPVAAVLAYRATGHLTPAMQFAVTLASGVVALLAHSSKSAARVLVTPSPEPVSNIALSAAGDVASISLTWAATRHPLVAGAAAISGLVVVVLLFRMIFRRLRRQFVTVQQRFRQAGTRLLSGGREKPAQP